MATHRPSSTSRRKSSSKSSDNYYSILGVEPTATNEQIKRAYRTLALQLHPDKNSDPQATARFQKVNKAYKILGDEKLRSTYDSLGSNAADLIDRYNDYPSTIRELSRCQRFLIHLFCCLTCCCCAGGFCLLCGCLCCCNFCCNHCCGLCAKNQVQDEPDGLSDVSGLSTGPHSTKVHQPSNDTNTKF